MLAPTLSESTPRSRPSPVVVSEVRPDGIAAITLDDRAAAHNTITPWVGAELEAAIEAAFADAEVRAVVVRSGKRDSFVVGANVGLVRRTRFARDAEDAARDVARCLGRLGSGPKPVVAFVHGPALGSGFELALACTAAIAADDPKTTLGLPEVKLGLVPAANGLYRVAERAGLRVALDLGVSGRSLRPEQALRLGLLDDVVPFGVGFETAVRLALRLATEPAYARALAKKRSHASGAKERIERALFEQNPIGRLALFRKARARMAKKTHGHCPAAERVVDLLERFGSRGFRAAAELEAQVFGDLAVSEAAQCSIDLFFARRAVDKDPGLEPKERAAPFVVDRVAVFGAGLMGAGIAALSARSGLCVRMKDTDDVVVGRGLRYAKELFDARVRRGSMSALERDAALARVSGATDFAGLRNTDLVIEAVFEGLALKHAVIGEVEKRVRDTCVIASNTSAIPIARIAEGALRPEMIVGMRYFSPVHRMPLLEVVRTEVSDPRAIATAVALGRRQGKTVIVVNDGPAFYTTRILYALLVEAMHLVAEGSSIEAVDGAMIDWGFPVGPFQLMDEIGLDLGVHVGEVAHDAFGERMRLPDAFAALAADGRKGRKNARGFYLYGSAAPRRKMVDATVYGVLGVAPKPHALSADEIALRCGLAMVNEALRCLDDGVLRSARDGDVGAIFGVGFPAFRGGPFRHVDVVGANEILRRMRTLEQRFGARFEPAPLLVTMARSGKRFYG